MNNDLDEANVMGQIAGMIAVMSAMVQALPPTTRKRLLQQLNREFESLFSAMDATGGDSTQAGREGAEWVRNLFRKQIAKADGKRAARGAKSAPREAIDIQL